LDVAWSLLIQIEVIGAGIVRVRNVSPIVPLNSGRLPMTCCHGSPFEDQEPSEKITNDPSRLSFSTMSSGSQVCLGEPLLTT